MDESDTPGPRYCDLNVTDNLRLQCCAPNGVPLPTRVLQLVTHSGRLLLSCSLVWREQCPDRTSPEHGCERQKRGGLIGIGQTESAHIVKRAAHCWKFRGMSWVRAKELGLCGDVCRSP